MDQLGSAVALMFIGLILYVIGVHFVFFLRRQGWLPGAQPNYHGLGNAYLGLQSLAEPEKQNILEIRLEEKQEEDDEGGPDDPTAHLRRRRSLKSNRR